ncbi:MAG: hypothetical protein IMY82_09195 [Chloroflexi bacterium]|nr:hypothetical protein [Chloroflexota bacterium]
MGIPGTSWEFRGHKRIAFLNRLGFLSQDFEVSWADPATDQGKNYILELQPREESQFIRRLLIVVARKAVRDDVEKHKIGQVFPILATTVYDLKGNRTRIEFAETRINQQLSGDFFILSDRKVWRSFGRRVSNWVFDVSAGNASREQKINRPGSFLLERFCDIRL